MTFERTPSASERERLARMRRSWQADKPSEFEVERARIRWLTRSHVSPGRGGPRALLVAAAVFGAAGALAATGAVTWPTANTDRPVAQHTIVTPFTAQPRSAPVGLVAPRSTARVPDTLGPPESVAPAKRTPSAASGRDSDRAPKSAPRSAVRFAAPEEAQTAPAQPSAGAPLSVEASGAWQRAADALRQGDDQRASQALQELRSSSDPYTRDTAALAKAQLDAAAGRWESALPVLRQLAAQGSTPLLRRRAGEVLVQAPSSQ